MASGIQRCTDRKKEIKRFRQNRITHDQNVIIIITTNQKDMTCVPKMKIQFIWGRPIASCVSSFCFTIETSVTIRMHVSGNPKILLLGARMANRFYNNNNDNNNNNNNECMQIAKKTETTVIRSPWPVSTQELVWNYRRQKGSQFLDYRSVCSFCSY